MFPESDNLNRYPGSPEGSHAMVLSWRRMMQVNTRRSVSSACLAICLLSAGAVAILVLLAFWRGMGDEAGQLWQGMGVCAAVFLVSLCISAAAACFSDHPQL